MAALEDPRQELEQILKQAARSQAIYNKIEITLNTEAIQGDGLAAQFVTGDIRNMDTGVITSVAIKRVPKWDYDCGVLFRNEYLFYSEIFQAMDYLHTQRSREIFDNLPRYYCGGIEPRKEYIAMEYLNPREYVNYPKEKYLDRQHLELIFNTYAKFHALSYFLRVKDLEKYDGLVKKLTKHRPDWLDKQMTDAISAAVDALNSEDNKALLEEVQDFGKNAYQLYLKSFDYDGKYRCVITGDPWIGNMVFKYSETGELVDMKIIDFQTCRDGSLVRDLSSFFYSSASKKDFDDLDRYLQIYHEAFTDFATRLSAKPNVLFSYEDLKNEWKKDALFGVIYGIFKWQIKLIPKEDYEDLVNPKNGQRPPVEESKKRWEVLLNKILKSESYRERTANILRHAFKYGVIDKNKIKI